ncbi:MAG TPA: class I SAM-dependent methyltransferase [Bacillota bacterium]|nr:class I SAM-dependent methyltransferase [Bacillota bacterium]HUM55941.1 class I SAM-dependent methyltransferase [Bacillota bacterium]
MQKLNDRLKAIASNISPGETVADIGTDHGFLPLFLWEKEISPKTILTDVSEKSLQKAKANAGAPQFGNQLDFRTGYGLSVIDPGEADVIVIAGMGGIVIKKILEKDPDKTKTFKKLLLQPRNNAGKLRCWLCRNGFYISGEYLAREGKYICQIIKAIPKEERGMPDAAGSIYDKQLSKEFNDIAPDDIRWEIPPWIFEKKNELASEFLKRALSTEEKILENIKKSKKVDEKEEEKIKTGINYLRSISLEEER